MYIRDGIAYASEPYDDLTITNFRIIKHPFSQTIYLNS